MDAAKRREARRKKLLESSEDRFKRIERLKNRSQEQEIIPCDSGNVGSSVQSTVEESPDLCQDAATLQPPNSEQKASTGKPKDGDSHTHSSKSSLPSHHALGCQTCHHTDRFHESPGSSTESPVEPEPIPRDISQDSGFMEGISSQSRTQSSEDQNCQSKAVDPSVQSVVSIQTLVFIILAVITRLWLVNLIHGQSIIVLFLATELLLFFIGIEQAPVQSGPVRILTALLAFRGVPPATVQQVQQYLGFFQGTLKDFSTYLFVFVMVHITMEWSSAPELDQPRSVPAL
ncbi:uncharacterized protein LOC121432086 isoform X2 [Lytechinus variegatus]|uniref:uncharacterized protein LOC121432086 isoform X2 n=1 Tax=Lytechinus variegatus TaxID=7654 RepID=UPI001BB18B34|nr:uncharacterized protein LOC121432086 isoform X2 [Lytechinus variegatus]